MIKKTIIFIFLLLLITGCNLGQIEDTNGVDNFTIQTFTDEDITSSRSSNSMFGSITTTINNYTKIQVKKFSGIKQLESINVSNKTLVYEIESTCTSGNFRIVIVKDGQIVRDVDINSNETITLNNANGTYKLKIVGESAKFTLKYSVNKG